MPEPPSNDALVVALRKALAVIERLEHERSSYGEGIAIVGMSCRFPGANSIEEFWELLENGVDAIAEVPRCRWDSEAESNREAGAINHRLGGFLRSVDEFDPRFFGISPREASRMDPQQRLFLEVSWEALEHAGIAPDSLINSRSGVFVGIAENDYQQVTNARTMNGDSDLYDATGSGYSFVSGRLAHVLGLQGPNMAVDTACSSSLVAIHLAVTSLQRRECQLAIAGGVQLRLLAATSIALSKAEALSPDGRCKAFDASANGFGRSEGCGVIVLKRLSDALVNNDRIFAVIRGSAINHDGPASGFTVPNEQAQVELIQEALRRAGVTADEVGYVEAHGTGTLLGDPIEMGALATVFGKRSHPLAIGSVKTNIGHLEGAAGIAGIIKTAMIVHEGWIPAHLHFTKPNPHIPWTALPVVIPTRLISWQDAIRQPARRRTAGVSSFSMSGANAHVILSEPPPQNRENIPFERPAHLLAVSAVSDAALRALVERYRDFVLAQESSGQTLGIADVCYTANTGRSHFSHRLGVIAESSSTLVASLTDWLADSPSSKITAGIAPSYRPPPKIAFLFCEQWVQSMGTELAATQPTFRTLLEQCGALADERLEQSLIEVLDGAQLTGAAGQAALFALEYSMAQLWRMWGIEPDLLFGHGLGEYAAACVAGVFSLADAMRLVVERGRLLEAAESGSGAMAARSAFESSARQIRYDKPRVPIVSSLNGGLAGGAVCEPTYWIRHLDQPAHLARGLQTLSVQGMDAFLEIGPQLPAEHWEQVLEAEQTRLPRLPSSGRHHWPAMLATLAKLYVQGARVDWQSFDRDYIPARKKLALPTYPFQRETYPLRAAVSTASPAISPLLDRMIRSPRHHVTIFETELSLPRLPFLADHHVFDVMVSPAACQLAMVLQASEKLLGQPGCILSDVVFPSALTLAADSPRQVQVHFARAERSSGFEFQVLSFPQGAPIDEAEMLSHAVGTLFPVACEAAESVPLETVRKRCLNAIPPEKWFEAIASCHIALGPTFRRTKTIWGGKDEVLLELIPAAGNLSQPGLLPSLLDACLQATALQLFDSPDPPATRLPFAIRELRLHQKVEGALGWCHARRTADHQWDMTLADAQGQTLVEIKAFQERSADRQTVQSHEDWREWLYRVQWQPLGQLVPPPVSGHITAVESWLIVGGREDEGSALAHELSTSPNRKIFCCDDSTQSTPAIQTYLSALAEAQAAAPLHGIVFFSRETAGREVPRQAIEATSRLLHLVQAVLQISASPRLWVLTQRTQAVDKRENVDPTSSVLWGFARTITAEHPDWHCTTIDYDQLHVATLVQELCVPSSEPQIAFRGDKRYVLRLSRWKPDLPAAQPVCLRLSSYGMPENIATQSQRRSVPGPGQVEIEVRGAGLNFRDVMIVLGMLRDHGAKGSGNVPAPHVRLGSECAGVVTAVGDAVPNLSVGDRVMALAEGSFASYVTVNSRHVAPLPSGLRWAEGATIPMAFLTAYFALVHCGTLQRGESILIHAAAGGVGLAAVQIAQAIGAEIFATVSEKKRAFIESLGVRHIFNSRTNNFAEGIARITAGRGVDMVLNSLSGEAIRSSLSSLSPRGRFVELGKVGTWTASELQAIRPDVTCHYFDLGDVAVAQPDIIANMFSRLAAMFGDHSLRPLPATVFPFTEVTNAVRLMQQAKHIGKIVISFPRISSELDARGTYLITGGLGGVGLQMARQLAMDGAGCLVLANRRPRMTPEVEGAIREMQQAGTRVRVVHADVSQEQDVTALLSTCASEGPLRGVIHAAGVLDDGVLFRQTVERLRTAMAAKVTGSWLLHQLTEGLPLDFFVCFSSTASLIEAGGQAGYAAANAFLDGLMRHRQSMGLPALSIHWGPLADVGMAAPLASQMQRAGWKMIPPEKGRQILRELLRCSGGEVAVVPATPALRAAMPFARLFQIGDAPPAALGAPSVKYRRQQLMASKPELRLTMLMQWVHAEVAAVLSWPQDQPIAPHELFSDLGMDSLTVVELRNRLQSMLDMRLSSTIALEYPNMEKLCSYLASALVLEPRDRESNLSQHPATPVDTTKSATLGELRDLLDGELDSFDRGKGQQI